MYNPLGNHGNTALSGIAPTLNKSKPQKPDTDMTIGSWTPDNDKTSTSDIDSAFLLRCIEHIEQGCEDKLAEAMSTEDRTRQSVMHCQQATWDNALVDMDEQQLVALIRFFTLVEEQLPGWEAGPNSPVIAIHRHLKARGVQLEKDLLLWIRQSSRNRFIPNGPIAL